jgi:hypothetical protein
MNNVLHVGGEGAPVETISDYIEALSRCPVGSDAYKAYQRFQSWKKSGMSFESLGDELETPLYAFCRLQEPDELRTKVYKRGPVISWQFRVPGQDQTSIGIKPAYRRITQQERNDPKDGALLYGDHPGSHQFDFRHDIVLMGPGLRLTGFVDHQDHLVAVHGDQDKARIVRDFYYAFAADPLAIFALESENCCLCGKKLTDRVSRSRGIGPDCFRGWEVRHA